MRQLHGGTMGNRFSVEQVTALCGGRLPEADGFHWQSVEHFRLEDGIFEPYRGDDLVPGPGIKIVVLLARALFPPPMTTKKGGATNGRTWLRSFEEQS